MLLQTTCNHLSQVEALNHSLSLLCNQLSRPCRKTCSYFFQSLQTLSYLTTVDYRPSVTKSMSTKFGKWLEASRSDCTLTNAKNSLHVHVIRSNIDILLNHSQQTWGTGILRCCWFYDCSRLEFVVADFDFWCSLL